MKQFLCLAFLAIHLGLMLAACGSGGEEGVPSGSLATLSWAPNNEADLAGYKVYLTKESGVYGPSLAEVPASVTSYQVPGLQSGNTYYFAVTAYNTTGKESTLSDEVSIAVQ
ncbi:hypothetical protein YTPLAS18_18720 [Nitrospira sp.]|nr:hypothetical protein YTPLAS18_18720 [Nitrospira sp.]